jgi:hypothetical protein
MEIINSLANAGLFNGFNLYFPLLSRYVFDSVCQIFAKIRKPVIKVVTPGVKMNVFYYGAYN